MPARPTGGKLSRHLGLDVATFRSAAHIAGRVVNDIWRHPGNRKRRGRALALFAAWQIWERSIGRPWTVRISPERVLKLYPHSPTASAFLYYGTPDYAELRFLSRWMADGGLFVDVGANIGAYSLFATVPRDSQAIAFEPDLEARERLLENIKLNDLEGRVKVLTSAVSSRSGAGPFSVGLGPRNTLVDAPTSDASIRSVMITTLDEALPSDAVPALVKVDVEGAELEVLRGGEAMLRRSRPALIVENNDPIGLRKLLTDLGYVIVRFDPDVPELAVMDEDKHPGGNVIAVPDAGGARIRLGIP